MVGSQYGEQEYVLLPGTNGIGTDGWPVTDARSPSATVVGVIHPKERFVVTQTEGSYLRVRLGTGIVGWTLSSLRGVRYLHPVRPTARAEPVRQLSGAASAATVAPVPSTFRAPHENRREAAPRQARPVPHHGTHRSAGIAATYPWQRGRGRAPNYGLVLERRRNQLREMDLAQHPDLLVEWNELIRELDIVLRHGFTSHLERLEGQNQGQRQGGVRPRSNSFLGFFFSSTKRPQAAPPQQTQARRRSNSFTSLFLYSPEEQHRAAMQQRKHLEQLRAQKQMGHSPSQHHQQESPVVSSTTEHLPTEEQQVPQQRQPQPQQQPQQHQQQTDTQVEELRRAEANRIARQLLAQQQPQNITQEISSGTTVIEATRTTQSTTALTPGPIPTAMVISKEGVTQDDQRHIVAETALRNQATRLARIQQELEAKEAAQRSELARKQTQLEAHEAARESELAERQAQLEAMEATRQIELTKQQAELEAKEAARCKELEQRQAEIDEQEAVRLKELARRQAELDAREAALQQSEQMALVQREQALQETVIPIKSEVSQSARRTVVGVQDQAMLLDVVDTNRVQDDALKSQEEALAARTVQFEARRTQLAQAERELLAAGIELPRAANAVRIPGLSLCRTKINSSSSVGTSPGTAAMKAEQLEFERIEQLTLMQGSDDDDLDQDASERVVDGQLEELINEAVLNAKAKFVQEDVKDKRLLAKGKSVPTKPKWRQEAEAKLKAEKAERRRFAAAEAKRTADKEQRRRDIEARKSKSGTAASRPSASFPGLSEREAHVRASKTEAATARLRARAQHTATTPASKVKVNNLTPNVTSEEKMRRAASKVLRRKLNLGVTEPTVL